jgi:SPP1 family predicted phage head-tail adaptor
MPRKFMPSLFNKKIQAGTVKSVLNRDTGDYDETFVSLFSLWAYPQKRSLTQQYNLVGTDLEDTVVLIVRHNDQLSKSLEVLYDGDYYNILDISIDNSLNYMSYDYLTIKLSSKVGGKSG